ncbi:MAG: uracil-DNA glycosylase [Gammaproteobacteria bacterium]|nr:uracil-DNA glycosylase [Gammaproteobacteria bacterium]MCP4091085.1 uracil-DNA glycosylase [Gammaproteobacteria bacterium]MCP4277389.1 uracil-DNA glycosylase [Gammaproteobacteria bacterium]MCP4831550.1 uracil-DNA glycosylase [Gammaproteobacteria bacterium]MCP4927773.1 uracil-DNA glycosylase [Gammaproteobacteria bacterium]
MGQVSAATLSAQQRAVLGEMEIDVWVTRSSTPAESPVLATDPLVEGGWEKLNKIIHECAHCELHQSRTQVVCGVGNKTADWLIIGEAPGVEEDKQGEPFVGRAGQLLNEMLRATGLVREQVFIANILKCRPPDDRNPSPDEVAQCMPYLQQQIEMLQPRLILLLGGVAAHNLLQVATPVGKLRGQVHHYGEANIPVVVTYHPAYLLRKPGQKNKSWDDLMLAMDVAQELENG